MSGSRREKFEEVRKLVKQGGYTHFVSLTDGMVSVFEAGECELCGWKTKEANSTMLIGVPIGLLEAVGLRRMEHEPPEVDMFEDGEFCCEMCRINADMDKEAV